MLLNASGDYRHSTVATHHLVEDEEYFDTIEYNAFEDLVDDLLDSVNPKPVKDTYVVTLNNVDQKPNFDLLHPLFGWAQADTVKRTFNVTPADEFPIL
jgi:hypothetical protein